MLSDNLDEICRFLAQYKDPKEIRQFLNSLFTPAELKDLHSRWEIVKLLTSGMTQRKIASQLHVSLCKITRGSKELKKPGSILKKAMQQLNS